MVRLKVSRATEIWLARDLGFALLYGQALLVDFIDLISLCLYKYNSFLDVLCMGEFPVL